MSQLLARCGSGKEQRAHPVTGGTGELSTTDAMAQLFGILRKGLKKRLSPFLLPGNLTQ